AGEALAADSTWNNAAGGLYQDPANWSAGVPGALESANFTTDGDYQITFTNDASGKLYLSNAAHVLFDLGGFVYTRPSLAPNFDINQDARLTVTHGTLNSLGVFSMGYTGDYATMTTRVSVAEGGVWNQGGSSFNIGYRYRSIFEVTNGGQLNTDMTATDGILIGRADTPYRGAGVVRVDGLGSTWTNYSTAVTSSQINLGYHAQSTGSIQVVNGGRVVHKGGSVYVGRNGVGLIDVSGGGVFESTEMSTGSVFYVGANAGSMGTVTVSGPGSELRIGSNSSSNGLTVGSSAGAQGTISLTEGGKIIHSGNDIHIGYGGIGFLGISTGSVFDAWNMNPNRNLIIGRTFLGVVTITGADAHLRMGKQAYTYIGYDVGGLGFLMISDGGKFTGSSNGLTVGYRSQGTVVVTAGGRMENVVGSGSVSVGQDAGNPAQWGRGSFQVSGAAAYGILGDLVAGRRYSTGEVSVAAGGTLEVYRQVTIGAGVTNFASAQGLGKLTVTGSNSVFRRTISVSGDYPLANFASYSNLGIGSAVWNTGSWDAYGMIEKQTNGYIRGQGLLVVEKGGLVDMGIGAIGLFSNSTVRVDGGRIRSGQLGMETGSVYNAVLRLGDADADALITVAGEVRLWGATLNVELGDDFLPVVDEVYTLIDAVTLNLLYNRFSFNGAILEDESVFTVNSTEFRIDYAPTQVLLTVIPEAGTFGLILGGVGLAVILRRRRAA
ncbi:MAG: hypothetical protein U1E27_03065, partial [Kiritimatiellia bacterium]|nr:hypothetical protein [Kiritimatiellia bacterium]